MGYTIAIGELEIVKDEYGKHKRVKTVELENAPAFGEPTDYTNNRWPSYTSWGKAMRFLGLEDLMFNERTGLMRSHPGTYRIFKHHKAKLDKAYVEFYKKYPNAKAGFSPIQLSDPFNEDNDWPEENNWAVRLEWLKFWIDWAFENCEKPYFYNS